MGVASALRLSAGANKSGLCSTPTLPPCWTGRGVVCGCKGRLACALALANAPANAQAGARPAPPEDRDTSTAGERRSGSAQAPTADDICRALEQSAAENALPVEFFARVIWQESRFDAQAVSQKGAAGIAQFMPATASWHGLADPFDPIEALRHSAAYLRELVNQFGNLGLMAAAYNAGPGRVSAWLATHRALPAETRHYVALVTGWTANEWASRRRKKRIRRFHKACPALDSPI
jgi:soluble lytic murein transglycosylase-like protein